jgi:hypothetical protein
VRCILRCCLAVRCEAATNCAVPPFGAPLLQAPDNMQASCSTSSPALRTPSVRPTRLPARARLMVRAAGGQVCLTNTQLLFRPLHAPEHRPTVLFTGRQRLQHLWHRPFKGPSRVREAVHSSCPSKYLYSSSPQAQPHQYQNQQHPQRQLQLQQQQQPVASKQQAAAATPRNSTSRCQ